MKHNPDFVPLAPIQDEPVTTIQTLGYELEVGNSSILLYKNRFLEMWDCRSMLSSIVHSDVYENAFLRYSTINCRISEVALTDEEVEILTPEPPKAKRSRK